MNQLFGCIGVDDEESAPPVAIPGAYPVDSDCGRPRAPGSRLRLFAGSGCRLRRWTSADGRRAVLVWGAPAHPEVAAADVPRWCGDLLRAGKYEGLRQLLGPFVACADEPDQGRVTLVTDVLGVRPMFVGSGPRGTVFGSDVWPLFKAGLVRGTIDYEAVASWVLYGYDCTGGSMFTELRRLPPGSVVTFEKGRRIDESYAPLDGGEERASTDEVVGALHDILCRTVRALLREEPRASCALSGGFDSRYVAALGRAVAPETPIECGTVATSAAEVSVAKQVAAALGVPLVVFPVRGSIWDVYDEPFHFLADGFPQSKFVTQLIAQHFPRVPMLNGFLGDSLIRGSHDHVRGRYEAEWMAGEQVNVLVRKHSLVRLDLLRERVRERVLARAREPMARAAVQGSRIGKVFAWTDLYHRQRYYISNNFLQHLDTAEVLAPFYSWELLAFKMRHAYGTFTRAVYERLLSTRCPALGGIRHAVDVSPERDPAPPIARCERRWAVTLMAGLSVGRGLSLLDRRRCLAMLGAALGGVRRAEWSVYNMQRLYLFERRVREAGVEFEWEGM